MSFRATTTAEGLEAKGTITMHATANKLLGYLDSTTREGS